MSLQSYLADVSLGDPAGAVLRLGAAAIRQAGEAHLKGRMIDVGCGMKRKALLVGDLIDEYVGLDHPDTIHNAAAAELLGTAYEIPAADASFDSLLCTAVLEHLEEPEAALREALRVMRPGAAAIYTIPLFWHVHEAPRDFYRYTRYGIQHLFAKAGFEQIEITALGGFWTTFLTEFGYFLFPYARGPLRYLLRGLMHLGNRIAPALDRCCPRPEFTWLYLVVARKPLSPQ